MAKKQIARWTAEETLRFLEIFRGYEALWDASHETYLKKMRGKKHYEVAIIAAIESQRSNRSV